MLKILKKNLSGRDWCFVVMCAVFVVVQVWLDLTVPDYTQKLTQSISEGVVQMSDVRRNGAMMLLFSLGSMIFSIFCGILAAQVAAHFAKNTREKLFGNILDFANNDINKFSTPSLITRTTNDVVQVQSIIAMGLQILIKSPITAVWALVKISGSGQKWTMAMLISILAIVLSLLILISLAYPKFKQIQKLTDNLNDVTRDNISGVRVVRAFNAESYQEEKLDRVNSAITANNLFTSRIMGMITPIMNIVMNGLTLAIYWIGAYLINQTDVAGRAETIGNMTAFTQYSTQVVGAFTMLIMIFTMMPRAMVSAKRIREVLDTAPSVTYRDKKVQTSSKGTVEFQNVSFSYAKTGEPCLKNLSFSIESGETFAIIGATGTGKTTLVNLISRFYDTTEGTILIDGQDIRSYPEEQLEKLISIAPQKAVLFTGDIKHNVAYGYQRDISDRNERLTRALEISQSDFVNDLEKGVNAEVAQGGTNFSGGQKQRLSIARAIFKDSEIMIFDDTFSALDYKTDRLVRKAINEQLFDTTVIIVAQRIGTIKNADKILVLHEGSIAGIGTHRELLENCPIYREIALSQLSENELNIAEEVL